jgi:hypothetical protein
MTEIAIPVPFSFGIGNLGVECAMDEDLDDDLTLIEEVSLVL